jgi:hypothetical protein
MTDAVGFVDGKCPHVCFAEDSLKAGHHQSFRRHKQQTNRILAKSLIVNSKVLKG